MKYYTSHCPKCKVLKTLTDNKKIEYTEIDNEDIYIPIAESNGIMSMPFAEIDGQILDTKQLQKYITEGEK